MNSASVRIIAVGDLCFNGRYRPRLARRGARYPFHRVLPEWREADLRLGNLESPITAAPKTFPSKLTLRAAPDAAAALSTAGFDCVTLANNHMLDFGPEGLADTRTALDARGMIHVGAGMDLAAASAPAVLHCKGRTIGVVAFCLVEQNSALYAGPTTPGVAPLDVDGAVRRIRELRPRVDWLIVQIHWGVEMSRLPTPEQRRWAARLAEAGADLIVGHHPHVLQPYETIGGVPVFYSLGNFLFSDMYWRGCSKTGDPFLTKLRLHPLSRRTGWAEVVLQRGRPAQAQFHPARLGRDLALRPERTAARDRDWEALCAALDAPDYDALAAAEGRRAQARLDWASAWRPIQRRIEMRLVHYGLVPFAVEAD
ncbi:MAG TPA: CapA family protein [Gemmataceae bacterium]|nr:CapA family protein [Gemmataceae bacterium]